MRTDSTSLSESALTAARTQAREMYGAEYVPDAPRHYEKKVKNAQEAHEAIRPAGDRFRTPAQVAGELRGEEFALYELIWKRTISSQMADARGSTASVRLGATLDDGAPAAHRRALGERHRHHLPRLPRRLRGGARRAPGGPSQGRGRRRSAACRGSVSAPPCAPCAPRRNGHETSPPPRYTEATLVKAMEERGIGRPSTYASTIGTIQDRGYVSNRGSALIPSWLAFAVTRLMEEHFSRLVDYDFTASMEEDLDAIARGDQQRAAWLHRFYFGDESSSAEGLRDLVEDLGDIDARAISTIDIGEGIVVRVGRYGPYVEEVVPAGIDPTTGEVTDAAALGDDGAPVTPRRATINDDIAPDELTPAMARELLEAAADDGRVLGQDPASGHEIVARAGRYGPYVTEVLPEADEAPAKGRAKAVKAKPRTASLFKDMDLATSTSTPR